MYNFYPGPSKVYPLVKHFAQEAFEIGILEKNHRSADFMNLLKECISLFKTHLNIPQNYKVFFTSSATECWEICAQSFLGVNAIQFYGNGAFGEKWEQYTRRIIPSSKYTSYGVDKEIPFVSYKNTDVLFVANETSNGTQVPISTIGRIYEEVGEGLLVLDVVSSLGGVNYDISKGDIWISSSQKCFGLPAGMGIMVVSPKALHRAKQINDRRFYNSALFIEENFDKLQTPYTPNILSIYLLKRLMERLENVSIVSGRLNTRAKSLYDFFDSTITFMPLVNNHEVRSSTVITLNYTINDKFKEYLAKNGVTIGKGYGQWKDSSFRVANFPAIDDSEYDFLCELLSTFAQNSH